MGSFLDAFDEGARITLWAIVGIAIVKLIMARVPVPGVKDVVALV